MRKFVLFAFNGELMCFIHVLLNALDMQEKGFDVKISYDEVLKISFPCGGKKTAVLNRSRW